MADVTKVSCTSMPYIAVHCGIWLFIKALSHRASPGGGVCNRNKLALNVGFILHEPGHISVAAADNDCDGNNHGDLYWSVKHLNTI